MYLKNMTTLERMTICSVTNVLPATALVNWNCHLENHLSVSKKDKHTHSL